MKKSIQETRLCGRADIYLLKPPSASVTASIRIRNWEHAFSTRADGSSVNTRRMVAIRLALVLWEVMLVMFSTLTKRGNPADSGRGGGVREGYKIVALFLKPSLGLFGLLGRRRVLPPATWLHQGITTLFSRSRYTLVLTFEPTSMKWGGMIWPSLETRPMTITVAENFVFITLGAFLLFMVIQICILRVLAMVMLSWLGLVESMNCTAAHPRSRSLNIVSLSDMIEGSYHSWDLYTTGQLIDDLQLKKKTGFH